MRTSTRAIVLCLLPALFACRSAPRAKPTGPGPTDSPIGVVTHLRTTNTSGELGALLTDLHAFTSDGEPFFGPPVEEAGPTSDGDRATAVVGRAEVTLRRLEDGAWYWFPRGSEDG